MLEPTSKNLTASLDTAIEAVEEFIAEDPSLIKDFRGTAILIADKIAVILAICIVFASRWIIELIKVKINNVTAYNNRKKAWKLEREIEINDILARILLLFNADRVVLSHFSNGELTTSNFPLKKLKITFERNSPGISRLNDRGSEVFVSYLLPHIVQLKDGKWHFSNTREIKDENCYANLAKNGVASQVERMFIKDGIPSAILTVQFVKAEKMITEQMLSEMDMLEVLFVQLKSLI